MFADKSSTSEKSASLLTYVDNVKTTPYQSVSSKSLLEERKKKIAEQTTFLTIYETEEEEKDYDKNNEKIKMNDMVKQKNANDNNNGDNDDEFTYFSIRSTKETVNDQNSDDKSIYFTIPLTTTNDRTTHIQQYQ